VGDIAYMETEKPTPRYTTREISQRLQCADNAAILLLKAAHVKHTKCGGLYLWDAATVESFLGKLDAATHENGGAK
jgi:hypothetical protein